MYHILLFSPTQITPFGSSTIQNQHDSNAGTTAQEVEGSYSWDKRYNSTCPNALSHSPHIIHSLIPPFLLNHLLWHNCPTAFTVTSETVCIPLAFRCTWLCPIISVSSSGLMLILWLWRVVSASAICQCPGNRPPSHPSHMAVLVLTCLPCPPSQVKWEGNRNWKHRAGALWNVNKENPSANELYPKDTEKGVEAASYSEHFG